MPPSGEPLPRVHESPHEGHLDAAHETGSASFPLSYRCNKRVLSLRPKNEPFAVPCGPFGDTQPLRSLREEVRLFAPDQILLLNVLWQALGRDETNQGVVDPNAQPQSHSTDPGHCPGLDDQSQALIGPHHHSTRERKLGRTEGVSGMILLTLLSK
jgi:hypothetical protein